MAAPARPWGLGQSDHPYFINLAEAFLHGRLALIHVRPDLHDISVFQGQYFLYWPPFPAVLFLPAVAVIGTDVSDVLLTILVGACNVAIVALLLDGMVERGITSLSPSQRAALVLFFMLGTVHTFLATHGGVNYTSQVVGYMVAGGAYVAAVKAPMRWAPALCGVLLGLTLLTRVSMLLTAPWVVWALARRLDEKDRGAALRGAVALAVPIFLAGVAFAAYNYARFGDPLEMGFRYHQMAEMFRDDYARYGAFNLHYVPINLFYNFLAFPYLALLGPNATVEFRMGGSIFLMSPVFFCGLFGIARSWRDDGRVLALSIALGLIPTLLVMGTGFVTFGPRYTLDVTPPLLVATAIGASRVPPRLLWALTTLSLIVYIPGTLLA